MLGQGNIETKRIFPKHLFWAHLGGLEAKSDFSTYLSIENSNSNFFLCYIPHKLTSLSRRKSWVIYAFSIEKKRFFHFSKLKFWDISFSSINSTGLYPIGKLLFFWILRIWINHPQLQLLQFRPFFWSFYLPGATFQNHSLNS